MRKIDAPCFNCQKRFLGCHSVCEDYKKFKELRETWNEQKHKEQKEIIRPYIRRPNNPWNV